MWTKRVGFSAMPSGVKIGIIGGSGLDDPDILLDRKEIDVSTPFGKPSDSIIGGQIENVDCFLLARHGRRHTIMPSDVNYRANIWALRELGCTHVIATTASGSLQEHIAPGHIVFPDQFIDRTTKRESTFYDGAPGSPKGICHIPMAAPFSKHLREILISSAKELGIEHHEKGTVVTIEGPRFSTLAESNLFRSWGGHVINMTTVPEVILAKEAGLLYAAIALSTDYDCWKADCAHVDVARVMETMRKNSDKALQIVRISIPKIRDRVWDRIVRDLEEEVSKAVML